MWFSLFVFSDVLISWVLADIGGTALRRGGLLPVHEKSACHMQTNQSRSYSPTTSSIRRLHSGPPSARSNDHRARYQRQAGVAPRPQGPRKSFKLASSEPADRPCLGFLLKATQKAAACVFRSLSLPPDPPCCFLYVPVWWDTLPPLGNYEQQALFSTATISRGSSGLIIPEYNATYLLKEP